MGALIVFKLLPGITFTIDSVNYTTTMSSYLTGTVVISTVISTFMAILQYVITHLILTRKLNLV